MVLQAGDPLGGNEVDAYHFERHDDQVWLVRPNLRFRWGSTDDLKTAAQRSLPMAILGSFRVEQEDPKKHLLLVNVTPMFFGDMFRLNDAINAMLGGQYGLDRDKSGIDSIKSFDQNAVIQATCTISAHAAQTANRSLIFSDLIRRTRSKMIAASL